MRDFKTLKELYASRLATLEGLAKELRRRQKELKENEGEHAVQRRMFSDVQRLLELKLAAVREAAGPGGLAGPPGGEDILAC